MRRWPCDSRSRTRSDTSSSTGPRPTPTTARSWRSSTRRSRSAPGRRRQGDHRAQRIREVLLRGRGRLGVREERLRHAERVRRPRERRDEQVREHAEGRHRGDQRTLPRRRTRDRALLRLPLRGGGLIQDRPARGDARTAPGHRRHAATAAAHRPPEGARADAAWHDAVAAGREGRGHRRRAGAGGGPAAARGGARALVRRRARATRSDRSSSRRSRATGARSRKGSGSSARRSSVCSRARTRARA